MTRPRELFVPARITDVHTYDPGEVSKVALTLPETFEVDGRPVPICDSHASRVGVPGETVWCSDPKVSPPNVYAFQLFG